MKKVFVLFIMFFVTFVTFAQASKGTQDQQACEYARSKRAAQVWQNYLRQFPQGACVFEAKSELAELKDKVLQWSGKASQMNWMMAVDYCKNLREGGYRDWRLPTIDELRTLIKNCPRTEVGGSCRVSEKQGCLSGGCRNNCSCQIIESDPNYYSKMGDSSTLWSSSVLEGDPSVSPYFKWLVTFYNGGVVADKIGEAKSVRCVR